jgi:hypothetical protein
MQTRLRGRPPIYETADHRLLVEATTMLRERRFARSPTEAFHYLAEVRGIIDERSKKSLAQRLRRKMERLNKLIPPNEGHNENEKNRRAITPRLS